MKKILMFVYNDLSKDARVQRAAEAASEIGALTVISCGNTNYNNIKYNNIEIKLKNGSNIKRYFLFIRQLIINVHHEKYDIIYGHDFYSALPLWIMMLKKFGKKFIYDAHELYIPTKHEKFSLRDRFFYYFEKKVIKRTDLVIATQEDRANIMKKHYHLSRLPLVVRNISYLPDNKINDDQLIDESLKRFFMINATCIVYAGVISKERHLDTVINVINDLGNNYKLLIIGCGDDEASIDLHIKSLNNINILHIPSVAYINLKKILVKCNIGFLSYPTSGLNNRYCAPNKIYEYASAGLAMVSAYNPTIEKELKKYGIGICDDDIRENIILLSSKLTEYKNNLKVFIQTNTWENEKKKLIKVLREL